MKIVIIGCGYVGRELAKLWSEKGYIVTCTTKTPQKLAELDAVCQQALPLKSSDEDTIDMLVKNNDLIMVTVAAQNLEDYKDTYLRIAEAIRKAALKYPPKSIFYTSSSSVYGEHHGHWVDEISPLRADSENAQLLVDTENTYLSLQKLGWSVTIFRLTEIYGPKRDLRVKMEKLQKRILPGDGKNYTNMIHLHDVIKAADYALTHHLEGIYNLSDDDHPIRKEFYNQLCHEFKLKNVLWDPHLQQIHEGSKRVSNHKIKSEGFVFQHPHRTFI